MPITIKVHSVSKNKSNIYKIMKNLIFITILFLSANVCAQTESKDTSIYVRIYDLQGKKIGMGDIQSISNTSLKLCNNRLVSNGYSDNFPLHRIGSIRTKHSGGQNVLVGAAGLAAVCVVVQLRDEESSYFGRSVDIILGAIGGAMGGAITGAISTIFKNVEVFEINGDLDKLKAFKDEVNH